MSETAEPKPQRKINSRGIDPSAVRLGDQFSVCFWPWGPLCLCNETVL